MSTTSTDNTSDDEYQFLVPDDEMEPELEFPELRWSDIRDKLAVRGNGAVELNPSKIPNAGFGVFASSRAYKAGEPITEYYGRLLSKTEADGVAEQGEHTHIVPLFNFRWYIDGLVAPCGTRSNPEAPGFFGQGVGAFVNSSRGTGRMANARFDFCDDAPPNLFGKVTRCEARNRHKYVRAIVDIERGEEILVDYKCA